MPDNGRYLFVNDRLILTPRPTFESSYLSLLQQLRELYPHVIKYIESGQSFSSMTVIYANGNESVEERLGSVYLHGLPRMGIVHNRGFTDQRGELYLEHLLEAFTHKWYIGQTIQDHSDSIRRLSELSESMPEIAFSLVSVHSRPERDVKIRAFGTQRRLEELVRELEHIPIAFRELSATIPSLGREGLGDDSLYKISV